MSRLMLLLFAVASMILVCRADWSPKYLLKVYKDGKDYYQQVSVDVKKGLETFHLQDASTGKDAGDIIYDLKRNLMIIRVPEEKACYLSEISTKNIPIPEDLLKLLKLLTGTAVKITPQSEVKLEVFGILKDLSGLSKEMVDLCAGLSVYRVTKGDEDLKQTNDAMEDSDRAQVHAKRAKRGCGLKCSIKCKSVCSLLGCYTVCRKKCSFKCTG
ncbi:uncharacterized protein LOC144641841 [Oculina patagonica]